jgi:nitric oxide reductase subunit C
LLSKKRARAFFLVGTGLCSVAFIGLTVDTLARVPAQTRAASITPAVERGKDLWDESNCMGCHTLFGEGAYYAPELTKVFDRRGPVFIDAMLANPEKMYPGQRKMWNYHFTPAQRADLVAFFEWAGKVDLNGFPARPSLGAVATIGASGAAGTANRASRPDVFNQLCLACHKLGGEGGAVGPALDGVGLRLPREQIVTWLHDPPAVKPGTAMPKLPLTEGQIQELAAFLSTQTTGGAP